MNAKIIATNRKARHEYHILETFEGGIILCGSEVKALREGKANIMEAYIRFIKNELYVIGMHIGKYSNSGYTSHLPIHDRKLLLHRKEIIKLQRMVEEKGKTLIPLSMRFRRGYVKIEFALAQGKKLWDKRKSKMDKDISRQIDREIKRNNI